MAGGGAERVLVSGFGGSEIEPGSEKGTDWAGGGLGASTMGWTRVVVAAVAGMEEEDVLEGEICEASGGVVVATSAEEAVEIGRN